MTIPEHNEIFSLAYEVTEHTSCNLFLTGKAGTGKTTFLKYVCKHTHKNTVVVAPTGVAAINAGGVTIHSFFQLPPQNFIPAYNTQINTASFANKYSLFRNMRLSRDKVNLMNEMELLIIDEVSMVRADLLDMIDESLRHFRNNKKPFGGVQVLFIGDMYQLPPVIKEEDWKILSKYYSTPFFFSAKALESNMPLFLELKKVYRQSEERFINILNSIRNNNCSQHTLDELNMRYSSSAKKRGITLVTHNYMADSINQEELKQLQAELFEFQADINGVFPESLFPCDTTLQLKVGAQVMFTKNDSSGKKRYHNGKLAILRSIDEDGITVQSAETEEIFPLEKETWRNIQYTLNKESGRIEEEEIGNFIQYPVRLAWAVTIHKSQGLTFDEVTIDAGKAFAAGQVYVALSRCRTIDGITLLSPVHSEDIITDKNIVEFSKNENQLDELTVTLKEEKRKYAAIVLIRAFSWSTIVKILEEFSKNTSTRQLPDKKFAIETVSVITKNAKEQNTIAFRFIDELEKRFSENPLNEQWLNHKVTAAKKFFIEKIQNELLSPLNELQETLKQKKKVRNFSKQVKEVETLLWRKIKVLECASYGNLAFEIAAVTKNTITTTEINSRRFAGKSKLETLALYKQGLKINEIAKQRGMAVSTIEGHLAGFITEGTVNIYDFMDETLLRKIKQVTERTGYDKLTPVKSELGDEVSFGQIKMAINHLKKVSAGV